jgi:hypothetical protein
MKKSLAILLSLFIASSSVAQTRPGGTGGTGTGGTGGGGTPRTGTGGTSGFNFGNSGFGTTSGTSGFGTTGGTTGGSGLGQTSGVGSFGQGFTFNGGFGLGASPMGMTGMGGRSSFGMGMGGMGMGMGGMGMGGMGMGGMGMGGRGGATGGRSGGMGGTQQQYQIRPTVKLGFTVATPSAAQRTQQFTSTIARLPQPERFAGVNVKVEGRKAIASGKLVSKADAKLLKNLLLMEPGIYDVDISALTGETKATPGASSPSDRAVIEEVQAVPTSR